MSWVAAVIRLMTNARSSPDGIPRGGRTTRITILNGNPSAKPVAFDGYLSALSQLLQERNHTAILHPLRQMDIRYCVGCLDCWVRTPGKCVVSDGSAVLCRDFINSDIVLFASPIIMGFTSALLKRAHDKLLPLVHPYFEWVGAEMHHMARYPTYPRIALLLQREEDSTGEDIEIITDIYRRTAINLKTSFVYSWETNRSAQEVADEIDGLQRVPARRS